MKTKDLRGSITVALDKKKKKPAEDDNPSGVNQWSGGAAAALKASQERHAAVLGHKITGVGQKIKSAEKATKKEGFVDRMKDMLTRHGRG
jgi:hypothetical protein